MTFADSSRQCDGLAKALNGYEKDLQNKAFSGCQNVKIEDLVKDVNFAIPDFLNEDMPGTTLSRKCSTLASVEAEIQKLKVEQSVLDGFEKLKASIQSAKDKTAEREAAVARRNGKTFVDRLSAAQGLEALVATRVKDRTADRTQGNIDRPILEVIRNRGPATKESLKDLVKELCGNEDKTDPADACNPLNFEPTDSAVEDIVNLINAHEKIEAAQLEQFRNSLQIKRKTPNAEGSTNYSFNQMSKEMREAFAKLDGKDPMSKAHLKAIKSLSDFESNPDFDIAQGLMTAGTQSEVKLASNKFMLHMRDSLSRQEYETRSKMSVMWEAHKDKMTNLPGTTTESCNKAKDNLEQAILCQNYLKEALPNVNNQTARADLGRALAAIEDNIVYHTKLSQDLNRCENLYKTEGAISEMCMGTISLTHANLGEKIIQLNALKDKIGSENVNLMKLRNFALYKWEKNNCGATTDATMDLCEVENSTLNVETKFTVSNALKVAILFAPSAQAEAEGKALCEDETISSKNPVCSDTYVPDVIPPVVLNEGVDGPTDAPDGGHNEAAVRDAWIGAGANLLKQALDYVIPRNTPPGLPNPYPYNYGPYNGGAPPLGIADTIMFNARYQGAYGFYMPTPGYQPYTAFGASSSISPYRSVSSGGGLFR